MSGLTTCLTTYEKKPNRGVAQLVARRVREREGHGFQIPDAHSSLFRRYAPYCLDQKPVKIKRFSRVFCIKEKAYRLLYKPSTTTIMPKSP